MAWEKQAFRTINGNFMARKDGTKVELSKGETDGKLYLRFMWPTGEHGKSRRPLSMQVDNLRFLMGQSDCINLAVDKADASAAAIRQMEAEKAAYEADVKALNDARSKFPKLFPDATYQENVDEIHAKYPNLFPPVPEVDPADVEGEVADEA